MDVTLNLTTEPVETAKGDDPLIVSPGTTIREVFVLLQMNGSGSALVTENDKLVGIFTERDALKLMARDADLDVPIEKVMVRDPVTIRQGACVADAIAKMSKGGYRRLPIVDEAGQVLGIVKVSGIVHYFVDHFPKTVFNLPPEPDVIMAEREGA